MFHIPVIAWHWCKQWSYTGLFVFQEEGNLRVDCQFRDRLSVEYLRGWVGILMAGLTYLNTFFLELDSTQQEVLAPTAFLDLYSHFISTIGLDAERFARLAAEHGIGNYGQPDLAVAPGSADTPVCRVCLVNNVTHLVFECGHCFCGDCLIRLFTCPVCRCAIVLRRRMFF